MCADPPFEHLLRLADLPPNKPHRFLVQPDDKASAAIAGHLGLSGLRKLRLAGQITRINADDWRLRAELGATVTQDCVVTLAPVVTRIDERVSRKYLANLPESSPADEVKMDEDESIEPLQAELDLGSVLVEELSLALPPYPHAKDIMPFEAQYAPPGADALDTDAMRPFAGLAKLRSPETETDNGNGDG